MKKILFVIAASFLSAICGAQQVDFGSIMTNKDGVVEEKAMEGDKVYVRI